MNASAEARLSAIPDACIDRNSISTEIGRKLFPADEAELIAGLIERDAPFYDADIFHDAVDGLMNFAKRYGVIKNAVPYEDLVATQFRHLWKE